MKIDYLTKILNSNLIRYTDYIFMVDGNYFRLDLSGKKIKLDYLELHIIRRDILLYFDENVGEANDPLMPRNIYKSDYWKYISIDFETEWAESSHYKRLIERGCLTLINGIILDILYEPVAKIDKTWSERKISINEIQAYVYAYTPSCSSLSKGRELLLQSLSFINQLSVDDIDQDGYFTDFRTAEQAEWFDENIVQKYYADMIKKWCQ